MRLRAVLPISLIAAVPLMAATPKKPNIILVVADDLGWGDLACYPKGEAWGDEAKTTTPNLDKLAATGVMCTQGYATGMVCAPSRAGLLTGKNQQRFGYYGFADTVPPFPADLKLLPAALKDAGYRTGMIGKWHLSFDESSRPLDRGFDRFFGFLGGQHDYYQPTVGEVMHGVGRGRDAHIFDQEEPVKEVKFLTDEFTDRAIDFMEQAGDTPFFLYLPYNAPHPPMQAPWEYLQKYAAPDGKFTPRDVAKASIESLDSNIGRIVDWLEEKGLRDDTLIVFTSDNGGSDGGPGRVLQHNGGLKGRKGTWYEGGTRVPFILNWPEGLPRGEVYKKPVSQLDLYPTFLAAAGDAGTEESAQLDGVNLLPYLDGTDPNAPRRQFYWCVDNDTAWAVRDGDWKLVLEDSDPDTLGGKFRGDAPREYVLQLYNIEADPLETRNLADENPEKVAELQKLMAAFRAQTKPSIATDEIMAQAKTRLAEREKNTPELNNANSPSGSPGHWKGGDKAEKPSKKAKPKKEKAPPEE
ncbi:MAG: sulfatase-like hydrolase/transferase [Chthoniobacterales bacterium]|nr:sulfatase-like hydrolase/transferase [Chthoniobacterales bacterium]